MVIGPDPRHIIRRRKTSWVSPKSIGLFFVFVSLGLLLYFASGDSSQANSPLSGILLKPMSLIERGKDTVAVILSGIMDNFRAKKILSALEMENALLRSENTELRFKLRKHESYADALGLPRDEGYPTIPAVIIYRDNRLTPSFIINRGSMNGLNINMPVWNSQGLVGRIDKISNRHARVQPITDSSSAVGVYVRGTPYEYLLRGTEDHKALVLLDEHLLEGGEDFQAPQPGQAVFTSGRGRIFPRDILAGYVSDATTENGILVTPAVDIHAVQSVLVLTENQSELVSLLADE